MESSKRSWQALALAALLAFVSSDAARAASRPAAPPSPPQATCLAGEIKLVRDKFGVPHIYAPTDEGAYYGLGYACAEDRIFQMAFERSTIKGELAKYLGMPTGNPGLFGTPVGQPAVYANHDVQMRQLGLYHHLVKEQIWPALEAGESPLPDLLTAYAAGVNDYVAANQAALASANVPPQMLAFPRGNWLPEDCIAMWLNFARRLGGTYGDNYEILNLELYECYLEHSNPPMTPEEALAAIADCDDVYDELGASTRCQLGLTAAIESYLSNNGYSLNESMGITAPGFSHMSQGWAVGKNLLGPGDVKAVLFGHPQIPLSKPGLFWEAHMEGANFRVRGACVPGTPNFMVGATDKTAWTATRLVMDTDDLYRLTLDPTGTQYYLDGDWKDIRIVQETVEVLGYNSIQTQYRETYWGPIVDSDPVSLVPTACGPALPGGCMISEDDEYAVRLPGFFEPSADPSVAYYDMYRSPNAGELYKAMAKLNWPPFNCVFADADGKVGYCVAGAMPLRQPDAPHLGAVAQIGDTILNDWIGLMPQEVKPHWINEDYAFSANNLPVSGSWYPLPLHSSGGHTDRSRRLLELLEGLKAQAGNVLPDEVIDMYKDDVYVPARDITRMAIYLRDKDLYTPTGNALSALAELEVWLNKGAHLGDHIVPKDNGRSLAVKIHVVDMYNHVDSLTEVYGKREAGASYWMRCRTDGILGHCAPQTGPCGEALETCPAGVPCAPLTFTQDEIDLIDDILAASWTLLECTISGSACPSMTGPCWEAWFTQEHLQRFVKKWLFFNTPFGPYSKPAHVFFVGVDHSETILSQGSQHYSQAVPLGTSTIDLGQSLMPLGQAEVEGTAHYDDQVEKWLDIRLKKFPMSSGALQQPTTTTCLSYP